MKRGSRLGVAGVLTPDRQTKKVEWVACRKYMVKSDRAKLIHDRFRLEGRMGEDQDGLGF